MQKISGLIVDVHDDYRGDVLRSLFPTQNDIPELVKSATVLSPNERSALPDDVFALVLRDGDTTLRKFACHDAGNTALSVLYFLKTAHKLPEEAQKTAAENLAVACGWYDLDVPEEIKQAGLLGKAMSVAQLPGAIANTKQNIQQNMQGIRAGEASGQTIVTPHEMKHASVKEADISGTSIAPHSPPNPADKKHFAVRKTAHMHPHVNVTGVEVSSPPVEKKASRFALGDRYPLDTFEQVKMASSYFDEFWKRMDPADRREYCVKLAERAEELNIPISKTAAAYAGTTYATYDRLKTAHDCRVNVLREAKHLDLLEAIFEKRAELEPELFAETLHEFDKLASIDYYYDRDVVDPFLSTFSEKRAEDDNWKETIGNDYITAAVLKRFASGKLAVVEAAFGDDFAKEFRKDPIGIFKSLPREQRKIVARMANDDMSTSALL